MRARRRSSREWLAQPTTSLPRIARIVTNVFWQAFSLVRSSAFRRSLRVEKRPEKRRPPKGGTTNAQSRAERLQRFLEEISKIRQPNQSFNVIYMSTLESCHADHFTEFTPH